jgi:hypothetical protein
MTASNMSISRSVELHGFAHTAMHPTLARTTRRSAKSGGRRSDPRDGARQAQRVPTRSALSRSARTTAALSALPNGGAGPMGWMGSIKPRSSREMSVVARGSPLNGRLVDGGTDGSNPSPSSGESCKPSVPRRVVRWSSYPSRVHGALCDSKRRRGLGVGGSSVSSFPLATFHSQLAMTCRALWCRE